MTRVLQIRFGLIFFIIFIAYYFDFKHFEFRWYQEYGGICEQWIDDDPRLGCSKGSGINIVNKLFFILDLPTIWFVWGITFLGAWFRKGNIILKLERASHLAKDVGEFVAALGAILALTKPFNEAGISQAFGVAFVGYFWGHITAIFLVTVANHLKTKDETKLVTP